MRLKRGDWVSCYENVGRVVGIRRGLAQVFFIGKTIDGKFGSLKGGCSAILANLKPYKAKGQS